MKVLLQDLESLKAKIESKEKEREILNNVTRVQGVNKTDGTFIVTAKSERFSKYG